MGIKYLSGLAMQDRAMHTLAYPFKVIILPRYANIRGTFGSIDSEMSAARVVHLLPNVTVLVCMVSHSSMSSCSTAAVYVS